VEVKRWRLRGERSRGRDGLREGDIDMVVLGDEMICESNI
jgi:hypothetical protein